MQTVTNEEDRHAQKRMREMHEMMELMTDWFSDVQKMESKQLVALMKLGAKVQKFLEMKDKLKLVAGNKPPA